MIITDQARIDAISKMSTDILCDGDTIYQRQGGVCIDSHTEYKVDEHAFIYVTVYQNKHEHAGFCNYSYATDSEIAQNDYQQVEQYVLEADTPEQIACYYELISKLYKENSGIQNY